MFFTDFRDSIEAKQRTLKLKTVIQKEIYFKPALATKQNVSSLIILSL
jgi:hypothetical protein